MASGLEVRVSYCDHRLVEYLWNVPWQLKTADSGEKGLLRDAMWGVLPDDVLARRKSPYPKTHNPGYREAVRAWLNQVLDDPSSPVLPLLNLTRVRAGGGAASPWFGQLMTLPQLLAHLAQVNEWAAYLPGDHTLGGPARQDCGRTGPEQDYAAARGNTWHLPENVTLSGLLPTAANR